MFRQREHDEATVRFLESQRSEPEQPDPAEPLDEALEAIDKTDTKRHCSVMTLLTLSVVMLFFGSCLLALTNKQDFTDDERFSFKGLASGRYLAHVESKFNDSVPLRDYLHNISEVMHWCYGLGNKLDLIDIQDKLRSEDPYSVETYDNFVPVDENDRADEEGTPDETGVTGDEGEETTMKDDGNNKKLSGVTLSVTQTAKKDDNSPDGNTTTTKSGSPGATTTTTVPPETTTKRTTTEDTETTPTETDTETTPTETGPTDTQPSDTEPSSEPDTEPPEDSAEE